MLSCVVFSKILAKIDGDWNFYEKKEKKLQFTENWSLISGEKFQKRAYYFSLLQINIKKLNCELLTYQNSLLNMYSYSLLVIPVKSVHEKQ